MTLSERTRAQRLNEQGNALIGQGALAEAEQCYRRALEFAADYHEARNNLGTALAMQGRMDEAATMYREAAELKPDYLDAWRNLGNACMALRRCADAATAFDKARELAPGDVATMEAHAEALGVLGRYAEANALAARALEKQPENPGLYETAGDILRRQGDFAAAVRSYERGLALQPRSMRARNNLSAALIDLGRFAEAETTLQRALDMDPPRAAVRANLGLLHRQRGEIDEALRRYREAVEMEPGGETIWSAYLTSLHYAQGVDPSALLAEHRRWAARLERTALPEVREYRNPPDPERRLRIGYVSPDWRQHSVAYFLEPLLRHHDHAQVEIFGYSCACRCDAVTDRLRGCCDYWRELGVMADADAVAAIREDGIDLLVDLAGHTQNNRLKIFARKPAPVQLAWLGYPGTTGLAAIDYRITDAWADPPGTTESFHSETLCRLSGGFLCYRPPASLPEVARPPCTARSAVTFGSFNAWPKVSQSCLRTWAKLLARVSGSRLLLKNKSLRDHDMHERVRERFARLGGDPARLDLLAYSPTQGEHLEAYARIDIALDTFPYCGTTTTCEALWMGCPVVTLTGRTHVQRVGASLLQQIGRTEWIAETETTYLEIATELAGDRERLAAVRQGLRTVLRASPLLDGKRLAREMEDAYRHAWRAWCARVTDSRA